MREIGCFVHRVDTRGIEKSEEGRRDFDITEIDITESDVVEFDTIENDITESDITRIGKLL